MEERLNRFSTRAGAESEAHRPADGYPRSGAPDRAIERTLSTMKTPPLFCWLLAITAFVPALLTAQQAPRVTVSNVRLAFDNGEHNAFTDMIRWKDKYWLAFRSCADGHPISSNGAVIVLSSPDTKVWKQACRIKVPERDARGPHFLAFKGKLFVFIGAIYASDESETAHSGMNRNNFGCTAFTRDGETWSEPTPLTGTNEYFVWGAASHKNKAYLSGRRTRRVASATEEGKYELLGETALFESHNGIDWKITSVYHQDRGDETSFLFQPNGDLVAVTRRGGPYPARLLRAKPPYREWLHKDFPFFIGGPLIKKWGDYHIVGGRRNSKDGKKTGLWWLVGDELQSMAILPSGGDNSYPGFAAIDDQHGLVSWYSSHETDESGEIITAIYVADLEITAPPRDSGDLKN